MFVSRARELNISRNEYDYIEEVVDSSCAILARLISGFHGKPLQYLPVRMFLRTISSSIFLLKALALGVRTTKRHEALHMLDQAVAALEFEQLDNIHLVSRYASLLKIQVSRLRETFADSGRKSESSQENTTCDTGGINSLQVHGQQTGPDSNSIDWFTQVSHPENWLSSPLDPLMAPFRSWGDASTDLELDGGYLDLDYIWNLLP